MITTVVNLTVCTLGMILGACVFVRDLKAFNKDNKTPSIDAWLVAVGTLAWSITLYSTYDGIVYYHSYTSSDIGLSGAEALGNLLLFIYWCGQLLKIKHYCRNRLKRKKQINQR